VNVSSPPTGYRSAASRTWPDHAGRAAPDAIYWMPPDPAIGEVRSAWSNQTTTGFRRLPAKQRAMLRLGFAIWAGVLTGVVGVALTGVLALLDVRLAIWIPYALASVPVALSLAVLARPRPQCTYLGDEGVAVHAQFGLGTRHHVLRFADARSLLREEVEEYPRGRYKGTRFVLRWRDAEDRVLLERRPPAGVWGGLWSVPELDARDASGAAKLARYGADASRLRVGAPLRHRFTHFLLEARVLHAESHAPPALADGDSPRWVDRAQLASLGLPTPIRALLAAPRSVRRARATP
jgi:hypothetical protein